MHPRGTSQNTNQHSSCVLLGLFCLLCVAHQHSNPARTSKCTWHTLHTPSKVIVKIIFINTPQCMSQAQAGLAALLHRHHPQTLPANPETPSTPSVGAAITWHAEPVVNNENV